MSKKSGPYTIKEFSKLTGVSADTLRYYDKINLFSPSFRDLNTGYRYYTLNEFENIGVIQTLQQLGLTLEEIKEYMNNKTFLSSYKLLKKQYDIISEKADELNLLKHYLDEKIKTLDDIMTNNLNDKITVKHYPKRIGYSSEHNCKNYQEIKIESARIIEKYRKSLFISNSYAVHIPHNDLISGNYKNNFYSVILDIEKEVNSSFKKIVYPESDYLTCQYFGTSFDRENTIEMLLKYIYEKNLTITGDAVQLCIVDENLTNFDHEKINEIQIPIN